MKACNFFDREATQMTTYSNAKVLVVDDEEVVRASYLRSLAGRHCQVRTANNGLDALQLLAQQSFDVVLLDQRMPGMDGMAVLKSIKSQWPDTEVIMVTGYPALDCAKEAVMLGAYDYLSKPIGPDEVLHAAHGAMTCKRWGLRTVDATSTIGGKHMRTIQGESK